MRCIRGHNGEAVAAQTHIAQQCEGAKRRVEAKKKARRNGDAPSNKTFGNCLLGFYCSQKASAENPAIPVFTVVASRQQESYQQDIHNFLWMTGGQDRLVEIRRGEVTKKVLCPDHSIRRRGQSDLDNLKLAPANKKIWRHHRCTRRSIFHDMKRPAAEPRLPQPPSRTCRLQQHKVHRLVAPHHQVDDLGLVLFRLGHLRLELLCAGDLDVVR